MNRVFTLSALSIGVESFRESCKRNIEGCKLDSSLTALHHPNYNHHGWHEKYYSETNQKFTTVMNALYQWFTYQAFRLNELDYVMLSPQLMILGHLAAIYAISLQVGTRKRLETSISRKLVAKPGFLQKKALKSNAVSYSYIPVGLEPTPLFVLSNWE